MANLSLILKNEITRLARKEIKGSIEPLRRANALHRKDIASLKRELSEIQRQLGRQSMPAAPKEETSVSADMPRISAKGIKSLRSKLGLSAANFGLLVGASLQSVYNWETGKAMPRATQRAAIAAIKGIGKREAAKRIAELS